MTGARAPYPAHARRVVWPEVARTSGPEVARVRACAFWPMARGRFCIPTKILIALASSRTRTETCANRCAILGNSCGY